MGQNRSRLFFRNKYTTTRLRSPKNKHLSKIIVFTIRQRIIIRPQTTRINIICILHPFHVQNHNYVNNTPIVLQPSSIAEKDSNHNNRPQKHSTHPQVENITLLPKYNYSLKNTITCLLKRQQYRSNRVGHFLRCVSMVFYNQKLFVRRRLRRYHLRHKIHAIKTRPNNPLRFLQHKNSIRHYLANDLTFSSFAKRRSEQENVFKTNNTRPNQKINRLNQSALILTQGLTTATCNAPSDHNLFLSHKITTTQQKTTNRNNQSNQTIRKNNTRNHSIKNIQKTNLQNKHDKPSHQSIVKSITKTTTTNNPKSLNQKHAQNKT